jgi:hypothetical protein
LIFLLAGAFANQGSIVNGFLGVSLITLDGCSLLPRRAEMAAIFFGMSYTNSVNHVFKPTPACEFNVSKIF